MKKAEKTLFGAFLLGLTFKINHWPGAAMLTVISLGLVSSLYFYLGFGIMNNIKLRNLFKKSSYFSLPTSNFIFGGLFGLSLSIIVIGFLFKFMIWPNANFLLYIGLIVLAIVAAIYFVLSTQNKVSLPKNSFIRVVSIAVIGITFYIIKTNSIIDFYYPDNPEYAEALKKVIKHPENMEYQKAHDELRKKGYRNSKTKK